MKFHEQFWPWKRFRADAAKISQLQKALNEERDHHQLTIRQHEETKAVVRAHEQASLTNQKHMRKMLSIIALKGGIPLQG